MVCDDVREDLEAFSLGTLDARTARQVETHLRGCRDCGEIVESYRLAVEYLALSAPRRRAPLSLRDRVLGGIGALAPFRLPRLLIEKPWIATAAAAVFLIVAIGGLTWSLSLTSRVSTLRQDNQDLITLSQLDADQRTALLRLQSDLASARTEQQKLSSTLQEQADLLIIALDPDLIPTDLAGTDIAPEARCSYVWSDSQGLGALTCKELPSLAFNLTYELWAVKGEHVLPVGTFVPRVDGTAQLLVKFPETTEGAVINLWVTMEQSNALVRSKPSEEVILTQQPASQATR